MRGVELRAGELARYLAVREEAAARRGRGVGGGRHVGRREGGAGDRLVAAAARRGYGPGDVVTTDEAARLLGASRSAAARAVARLREEGRWPYRPGRQGGPPR